MKKANITYYDINKRPRNVEELKKEIESGIDPHVFTRLERFKDNNGWWHSYIAIYAHGLMLESDFNNIQKIKQGIKVEGLKKQLKEVFANEAL